MNRDCGQTTNSLVITSEETWRAKIEELESQLNTAQTEGRRMCMALMEERNKIQTELSDKKWVIQRIEEELEYAGIELQWTDGGGSFAPSGWHRNPYLSITNHKTLLKEIDTLQQDLADFHDWEKKHNTNTGCVDERQGREKAEHNLSILEDRLAGLMLTLGQTDFNKASMTAFNLRAHVERLRKVLEHAVAEFEAEADEYEERHGGERPQSSWVLEAKAALKSLKEGTKND